MQAVAIKRNPATRIGIAALAVVILAALTLGLILLNASDEQPVIEPAPSVNRLEEIALLEDNQPLPVYAGNPAHALVEMRLIEENIAFQTQVNGTYLDIKLIEDNVALPVNTVSSVRIHPNMQVEK